MALTTGTYAPKHEKTVYHWPEPDVNGDGERVQEDKRDGNGNVVGRNYVMDKGMPVKAYKVPEGFREIRSFDGSSAYVLHDASGNIVRNVNDEAINIAPGQTIIVHPDGMHEVLQDDYSRYLFEQWHDRVSDDAKPKENPVSEQSSPATDEYDEFLAWKSSKENGGQ